jgi:hypothetical protein
MITSPLQRCLETQHFSNTLLSTFSASQYFQIQIILLNFSHLPFKTKYPYYWVFIMVLWTCLYKPVSLHPFNTYATLTQCHTINTIQY